MAQQTIMTSIIRCCVRGTTQIRYAELYREWKRRRRLTIPLLLIMVVARTIETFINFEICNCIISLSGLPP